VSTKVLLVEDDARIRRALRLALIDENYEVIEAGTGEQGLAAMAAQKPDIVLLDLMLPGMNGIDVCRAIRERGGLPVIIVTARGESSNVVAGLEAGADDYVTKPLVAQELTARIAALLRRSRPPSPPDRTVVVRGLEVLCGQGRVRRDGVDLHLTKTEFRLLCELAAEPGVVVSREQLLERVWGYDYFGDTRLLDVHIRRLRRKVEPDPQAPSYILTVRGTGYRLDA
jgi:two-component system response regulator MtrA